MKVQFVVILNPGEPSPQVSTVTLEVPVTVPQEVSNQLSEIAGQVAELNQIVNN